MKEGETMKRSMLFLGLTLLAVLGPNVAFAADGAMGGNSLLAIGAGIAVGFAALGGTLGQGKAAGAALDSIGRNPAAAGKLLVPMILGLALIESLVILAWVIANNIAGKL